MTVVWQPVRSRGSLPGRIAAQIEKLIAAEELKPGDRLPAERDLAGLLGVSRPSVREAVQQLAAQGRVSVRHGQGVFVAADDTTRRLRARLSRQTTDFEEVFATREVLEVPAAGWAAEQATPAAIDQIRQAYEALTSAVSRRPVDWDELQHLDLAFHESVVRAGGNRFMLRILGVLHEVIESGMQTTLQVPGRLERSAHDHARILAAVAAGDPTAARSAARRHIRGALAAARRTPGESEEGSGDAATESTDRLHIRPAPLTHR